MIPVTTMRGRKVALFGLGGSGLSTALALREGGAEVVAWDDNPDRVAEARARGVACADLRAEDWSGFASLVLAPGVPLTHPKSHWTVELAREAGVEVIGDIELFCRERAATRPSAPFVAVTGTNGKSTTTALIAHLLRGAGRDVQMGGNIGVPILDLEPPAAERVHVVECSSYQIDLAPSLAPTVGVLLNVTPDHLDRHGTFERYAAIKERLVARADRRVIATDDETTRAIAARLYPVVTFAATHAEASYVTASGFLDRIPTGGLARLNDLPTLRGPHNIQNAAAALLACMALGHPVREMEPHLRTFPGLAHRMEMLPDWRGITFVNDSKATNADAAAPALGTFGRVRWIAGGLAKDGGIEPLRPLFERVQRAYLIGEAAPSFAASLGEGTPFEIAGTLDVAVRRATEDALSDGGGAILFSPAAASFDQFRNFEKRGEAFRDAVAALIAEHDGKGAAT